MAAATPTPPLERACLQLRSMTEFPAILSKNSQPNAPRLQAYLHRISLRYRSFSAICAQEGSDCTAARPGPSRHEILMFFTDFAKYLNSTVLQLDALGSKLRGAVGPSIIRAEQDIHDQLWHFLVAACGAFQACTACADGRGIHIWTEEHQHIHTHLLTSFHSLLLWLLPMLQEQHLIKPISPKRYSELNRLLVPPAESVMKFLCAPTPPGIHRTMLLPANYLQLLCGIISHQFYHSPSSLWPGQKLDDFQAVRFQALEYTTTALAIFSVPMLHIIHKNLMHMVLASPAVLQALKLITIHCAAGTLGTVKYAFVDTCAVCMFHGLKSSLHNVHKSPMLSGPDQVGNQNALGLPLHLNPLLSSPSLELDTQLLHALSTLIKCRLLPQSTSADVMWLHRMVTVQALTLEDWKNTSKTYMVSEATVCIMGMSVVGLAQLCSKFGLLLLQQEQQLKELAVCGPGNKKLKGKLQRRSKHPQLSRLLDSEVQGGGVILALSCAETMQAFRHLMFLTSDFQLYKPDGSWHIMRGE